MTARTLLGRILSRPRILRGTGAAHRHNSRRWNLQHLEDRVTPVTNTWTGGSDLWSVQGDWSQGHVPTNLEDVVINTNVTVTHNAGSDSVNSLSISGGGTLVLSGGSIADATTLDAQAGNTVTLSGGTLAGATVTAGSTITATTSAGTLSGVTLAGTLDLTENYGVRAYVTGGLTLSGGIIQIGSNTGIYCILSFDGSQTLGGNGTVVFGTSYYNSLLAGPTAGSALTIGPNVLVHGSTGWIGYHPNWSPSTNVSFTNQGTIQADMAGGTIYLSGNNWTNTGTIRAAGGSLNLLNSWTNTGTFTSAGDSSPIAASAGATEFGNTVTITTTAAHGFTVGQSVTIAGVGIPNYNGTFTIASVPTATTFTYTVGFLGQSDSGGGTATLNSTLNLGGNFATATLGTVTSTGGAIDLSGLLTNTGNTLTLNATTGSWQLLGGTIDGGTVTTAGGTALVGTNSGGTLANSVTLNGTLDLTNYYDRVAVTGGLTLNGTVLIGSTSGIYSILSFDGSQTLGGNGTVVFGTSIYNFLQAGPTAASALTIGPNILVRGHSGGIGYHPNWSPSTNVRFTNQGTIRADLAGGTISLNGINWTNTGTVRAAGGAVNLLGFWTNNGTITSAGDPSPIAASSGATEVGNTVTIATTAAHGFTVGQSVTIAGVGVASYNGTFTIATVPTATTFTYTDGNAGLADSGGGTATLNSTLNLGGTFATATMGAVASTGGAIDLTGAITNTGDTLTLNATTGSWQLAGGVIDGGTVTMAGGAILVGTNLGGTLANSVTLNGTLDLTTNYDRVAVTGGLTLNGTVLIGSTSGVYSILSFDGTQTLGGNGTVVFGTSYYNFLQAGPTAASALTIGPNILVRGHTGSIGYHPTWSPSTSVRFNNQGTIQADVAGGTITAMNDTNFSGGTLTGGHWKAVNSTLRLVGANITTNAADVVLDGAASNFFSDTGTTDALAGLSANAAAGNFTIQNGRDFTAYGRLTNAGNLTVGAGSTLAVNGQYASSVLAFSSQYTSTSWSAAQALGPPNTSFYGDYPTSWAPSSFNGTQEFLTLGFATPDFSDGAIVRETNGNGFVTQIDAIDTSNVVHTVWTGIDPSAPGIPVNFFASWSRTAYLVKALKIYVNTDHNLGTFEEIDSVQLVGPHTGFAQSAGSTTVAAGGAFTLPAGAHFTQTGGTTTVNGNLTDLTPPTGNTLAFNGTNDTVEAPDSSSLDLTTNFTLEAWINPTAITGVDRPVISKVGGGAGDNGYQFGVTSDSRLFVMFNAQGEPWGSNKLQSPQVELLNKWSHIAATYDNNTESLYLNGQLIASQVVGPKSVIDSAAPLRLGGDSNNTVFFSGQIDEARVWNTARTQADLQANSGHTLFGTEAGLAGYWPLDEGAGTTAFDQTANHNDGVLVAGQQPTWVSTAHGGTVDLQGGVLDGNGTVDMNVVNAATIAPSMGPLFVAGDYSQTSTGALNVSMGGVAGNQFGQLQVDGAVNLDGGLNVNFATGFFPAVGNSFPVLDKMSAGPIGTTFVGYGEGSALNAAGPTKFRVTYAGGDGNDLNLTAVNLAPTLDTIPDPAAILASAGVQQINLTGISSGNTNAQVLTVTAVSSNPAFIPNPTVTYTSPNATGSLSYTPVPVHFGTAIITVTVTDDGGTALGGVNQVIQTFTVTVNHISPVLPTDPIRMLVPEPVRTKPTVTKPVGTPISNLLVGSTNADGIAITGLDNTKGVWEFSLDDGTSWNSVPPVSTTAALVLTADSNTLVGFLPSLKFQGFASLSYKGWDHTDGATAGTLVDTTAAPTAYTSTTERGWVAVGKTKPVLAASGATLLTSVPENAVGSHSFAVKSLLGIAALESLPLTNVGIAITGLGSATGTWQYKLLKTKVFVNVDPTVSTSHALLLRPTDSLRFIPAIEAVGEGDLKFKTWVPTAAFGTYVDTAVTAGIGVDSGSATIPITVFNELPVLDPTSHPTLGSVNPGDPPLASTIAALGLAMTDEESATLGIQVLVATGGTWEYSKNGTTWTKVTKPVYLAATDSIRFTAAASAVAGTATLTFKAWDGKAVSKAKDNLTVTIV